MNALNALAAGDFRALMDGLLSDDRIEGRSPCPCGQLNDVIVVRTGCVIVMWTNAVTVHAAASEYPDELSVVSYRSVANAMQAMDGFRSELERLNGLAQLVRAVNGAAPQQEEDAGLAWLLAPGN